MMVDREKLARRLMATYLEELQEHVGSLNRNLLAMEEGPAPDEQPELYNLLFRAAHSLKGASRAVNVELIENVCHQMEEVLGAARDGKLELKPAHYVVLFKGVDGIEDAGNRLRESRDLSDSPLLELLPELTAAVAADFSPSDAASPSGPESQSKPEPVPSTTSDSLPTDSLPTDSLPTESQPPESQPPESQPGSPAATAAQRTQPKQAALSATAGVPVPKAETASPPATPPSPNPTTDHVPQSKPRVKAKKAARKPRKRAAKKPAAKRAKKAAPKSSPRVTSSDAADTRPATTLGDGTAPSDTGERSISAASATTRRAASNSASPSASIRVSAEKLDALLAQSGELLVARRRVQSRVGDIEDLRDMVTECRTEWRATAKPLEALTNKGSQASQVELQRLLETINLNREALTRLERGLERVGTRLSRDGGLLNQACTALEDEVHRVRMLPFAEACGGLERAVRDVARATGKDVRLQIGGKDVELDRAILEGLKDPLMHLVRNGVDHGIETPEQRLAAGKSAEATLTVSASMHGGQVEIIVEDDGQGFDIERIREKARAQGLPQPNDDQAVAKLVFMAGFSTAATVTNISGRGVGLDVVQAQIEALQGSVDLEYTAGLGSRFTLRLPLTLTTTRAIMARSGQQTYAIPTVNVQQILRIAPTEVHTIGGRHVLALGGPPLPVARLADTLGMEHADDASDDAKLLVVVMGSGSISAATIVDELLAEQEITIKHLGRRIRHIRHISGGTLLPSGEIALVLNVANLIRTQLSDGVPAPIVPRETKPVEAAPRRLLVVDDSVTTRALMQAILESAGFNVQTAADGRFALEKLDQGKFDLVVSDVDMPRLNGFGLTEAIRKSDRLARTPVILVTSRGTDEDKARGIQAGADGYIVKADFEGHSLVETIQQLL